MAYKFIFFDLDDTLLDHRTAERAGLTDVHQHFSIFDRIGTGDLIDTYQRINGGLWKQYSGGEITREQLQRNRFEKTLQHLNLDASRYGEIGRYYMSCYRNHWQWIEGAKETFDRIRSQYPVGILTNGFAETQRKKFESFGLYTAADCTVISEEVGALKPDPKVFEYATNLAGIAPDDVLYIGDSYASDIEGGTRFGWNTAWFTAQGDAEEYQQAEFVFDNFGALEALLNL